MNRRTGWERVRLTVATGAAVFLSGVSSEFVWPACGAPQASSRGEAASGAASGQDVKEALKQVREQFLKLFAQGKYAEAMPVALHAVELNRQAFGKQHIEYARSLNNLAALYYATGRYQEAEALFKQTLEIKKQTLGEQHPDYAFSLNNLANLYSTTGRYEEAEPLYRQALALRKQALGDRHPDYATSLNDLARPDKPSDSEDE